MALKKHISAALGAAALFIGTTAQAGSVDIQVEFTNNAPSNGVIFTPVWTAFHDGSFDTFNLGEKASAGLESLAEDGNTAGLSNEFNASSAGSNGGVDGTLAGIVGPGGTSNGIFTVSTTGNNDYFSYASMLLPSSDFFIANNNPLDISDLLDGVVSSFSFDVFRVYDAGTEVNDFGTAPTPPNAARGIPGGQTGPNQGADENGLVTFVAAAGESQPALSALVAFDSFLNSEGLPQQLFLDLNFSSYESIGSFTLTNVSEVPVPAAAFLFGPALLGFLGLRRKAKVA